MFIAGTAIEPPCSSCGKALLVRSLPPLKTAAEHEAWLEERATPEWAEKVSQLSAMGFETWQCENALLSEGGDVMKAVNSLLMG